MNLLGKYSKYIILCVMFPATKSRQNKFHRMGKIAQDYLEFLRIFHCFGKEFRKIILVHSSINIVRVKKNLFMLV